MPPKTSTKAVRRNLPMKTTGKEGQRVGSASKKPRGVPTQCLARIRGIAPEPLQKIRVERKLRVVTPQEAVNTRATRSSKCKTKQRAQASTPALPAGPEILPQLSNKISRKKPQSKPATHEATAANFNPPRSTRTIERLPSQSERIKSWAGQAFPGLPSDRSISSSAPHPELASSLIREFYESRGYLVPSSKEMETTTGDGTITPSQAGQKSNGQKKKKRRASFKPRDKEFWSALREHNIGWRPTDDSKIDEWKSLVEGDPGSITENEPVTRDDRTGVPDEARWRVDMEACFGASEAMFQRTTMMTILDRHVLDDKLSYVCEAQWISDRFPGRSCKLKDCNMCKPRPDLVVAFKPMKLLPEGQSEKGSQYPTPAVLVEHPTLPQGVEMGYPGVPQAKAELGYISVALLGLDILGK
ncbi:MAG: hypothetical protein Q9187_006673 [Circinaria calcarea]